MIPYLLAVFVKCLLWLRYRVSLTGLDAISSRGSRGILFLPNHPALIDPFIVISRLYRAFRPRFLADRDQLRRPFVGWLALRAGALTIPDVSKYGLNAKSEIDAALDQGIEGLRRGENWLFYPAGRVYRRYLEDLGGNSAVEKILHSVPSARVVLLRTRGLWGSGFSRSSGGVPSVTRTLLKGALGLLSSGIFFAPRRRVTVKFLEPADLPRGADRFVINRYLEDFYNDRAPRNTCVPYSLWERAPARELPEPGALRASGALAAVTRDTRESVLAKLREMTGISSINDDHLLGRDLGLDSLSRVDLSLWIEDRFGFPPPDPEGLQSVADLLEAAAGGAVGSRDITLKPVPRDWSTSRPLLPSEGNLVTQAFLSQARRAPHRPVLVDEASGLLTYRDIVTRILLLKPFLERLEGDYLGIMLPASVAVNVVYLATLFAGKTPVMVNWTVGPRNMEHSLRLLGVRRVLTSRLLLKRLEPQMGGFGDAADSFVFLEDLASRIPLHRKAWTSLRSRFSWRPLDEALVPGVAVVLFTSGSESLPKAVPLTHENLLTNLRDGLSTLTLRPTDRVLGLFPPFHSFGVTCNMMIPLLVGLPTVYHPNPTDGAVLAKIARAYKCTIVFGTPTFLKAIVRASAEGDLSTLRLAVTGAEKCPDSVYSALKKACPGMTILEGYGITECSPIVSVNDYRSPRPGTIGKVLKSLEYAIVDPDRNTRAAPAAPGVLLVRGPSVFPGYLNYSGDPPFVEFEGKSWYRTGDIVSESPDGVLTFRGRLKRFVKIGGEMISLPAVESALEPHYSSDADKGPVLAVESTGDESRPELILFTTKDTDRETVNRQLRSAGLSGLYNISRVIRLPDLPLLGTGKTDYRALKALLAKGA